MITVEELRGFLNYPELPDNLGQSAISTAVNRVKKLLKVDTLAETDEIKKAVLLFAAVEVASRTNLYWRKENYEVINVKMLVAEAERILNLIPEKTGGMLWKSN